MRRAGVFILLMCLLAFSSTALATQDPCPRNQRHPNDDKSQECKPMIWLDTVWELCEFFAIGAGGGGGVSMTARASFVARSRNGVVAVGAPMLGGAAAAIAVGIAFGLWWPAGVGLALVLLAGMGVVEHKAYKVRMAAAGR